MSTHISAKLMVVWKNILIICARNVDTQKFRLSEKERKHKIMIITGMAHFESVCKNKLVDWYNNMGGTKFDKFPAIDLSNVFVVWSCKTLQNYKALLSTTISGDGIYAEYTYNGDKKELYEDVYKKINKCLYCKRMIDYKDIDKGMRPIIKELNDKGYATKFCCEGHFNELKNRYMTAYIYFEKPLSESIYPLIEGYRLIDKKDKWKKIRCKYPYMWVEADGKLFYWIGSAYDKTDKDKEHDDFLKMLLNWAKGL